MTSHPSERCDVVIFKNASVTFSFCTVMFIGLMGSAKVKWSVPVECLEFQSTPVEVAIMKWEGEWRERCHDS